MENIYLFNFNNYYNRIVAKHDDLLEYGAPLVSLYRTNFIPGDGVNTSHVFNANKENLIGCDYCVVCDETDNILSRWYIMSHERTRAGQYIVHLLRDVMADFRDEVLDSIAYIRRGNIEINNPLIYNDEGLRFNQIKKREDLLYDKTGTSWIVGYVAPNATELKGASIVTSGDNAPLTNYQEILQYSQNPLHVIESNPVISFLADIYTNDGKGPERGYRYSFIPSNNSKELSGASASDKIKPTEYNIEEFAYSQGRNVSPGEVVQALQQTFKGGSSLIKDAMADSISQLSTSNYYRSFNGKIVLNSQSGKYYRIRVTQGESVIYLIDVSDPRYRGDRFYNYPRLYEVVNNAILQSGLLTNSGSFAWGLSYAFRISYFDVQYLLTLEEINYGDYAVSLSTIARVLQDAPYRMFCMKNTPENLALAIALNTQNGSAFYDIQVLPYCPVQNYFNDDGSMIPISTLTEHVEYEKITNGPSGPTVMDYLFWATWSEFTFDIPYTIDINDPKIESQTDVYRLCSPNGNGNFEFNAAKNGGINTINVDCTYRPYDPYIHLNPNFGELYGKDFNDFRGLILNGDFSIPAINDAWVQYTIQNKNYQNIFNREIQSLELQNRIAGKQDIFNAIVGTVQGGISGAAAGAMAGGPYAAIAGAVVGTAASGIGGVIDVQYNRQLREDQRNLKESLFNYNLQNIQALPQSVSKTGCLTYNNKLVPYIEYYTCTDQEKEALQNVIKYTGMSVGVTGRIGDYVSPGYGFENAKYIQADMIYIELDEDYHLTMEIVKTLQGGIRFA